MPTAILAGGLAALATLLTLVTVTRFTGFVTRNSGVLAAFAAGALVTATLVHLLPMAYAETPEAPVWTLAGFAAAFLFNRGALALAHDDQARGRAAGLAATAAIAFHSFIDGLAYAVTFAVDQLTGAVTALGLILHEAPEAVIVFTLLQAAGLSVRASAVIAFVAAGLTTPLGAIVGVTSLALVTPGTLDVLLALAAGVLLFVAAGHLLPHVEREPARRALPALMLGGVVVMAALSTHGAVGHVH